MRAVEAGHAVRLDAGGAPGEPPLQKKKKKRKQHSNKGVDLCDFVGVHGSTRHHDRGDGVAAPVVVDTGFHACSAVVGRRCKHCARGICAKEPQKPVDPSC